MTYYQENYETKLRTEWDGQFKLVNYLSDGTCYELFHNKPIIDYESITSWSAEMSKIQSDNENLIM